MEEEAAVIPTEESAEEVEQTDIEEEDQERFDDSDSGTGSGSGAERARLEEELKVQVDHKRAKEAAYRDYWIQQPIIEPLYKRYFTRYEFVLSLLTAVCLLLAILLKSACIQIEEIIKCIDII